MSKGSKRRQGTGYEDNYDKIFGSKAERDKRGAARCRVRTEAGTGSRTGNRSRDRKNFEPFVSPIDQTVISCPAKLRAHNKRHGVTNIRDYGDDWFKRKHIERSNELTGNTEQARKERIEVVKDTLQQFGVIRK